MLTPVPIPQPRSYSTLGVAPAGVAQQSPVVESFLPLIKKIAFRMPVPGNFPLNWAYIPVLSYAMRYVQCALCSGEQTEKRN